MIFFLNKRFRPLIKLCYIKGYMLLIPVNNILNITLNKHVTDRIRHLGYMYTIYTCTIHTIYVLGWIDIKLE